MNTHTQFAWRKDTKGALDRRSKDQIGDKEFTGPSGTSRVCVCVCF